MSEPPTAIGLLAEERLFAADARKLAERFGLRLLKCPPGTGFYLCLTAQGLELREAGPDAPGPVRVEFAAGAMAHRLRFGGGRGQPLARAVGIKPGFTPIIWDATAGLGRDGFVLASLGCEVTLCERSAPLAAMLADGLQRAALHADIGDWVKRRLRLVHADAGCELRRLDTAAATRRGVPGPHVPGGQGPRDGEKGNARRAAAGRPRSGLAGTPRGGARLRATARRGQAAAAGRLVERAETQLVH